MHLLLIFTITGYNAILISPWIVFAKLLLRCIQVEYHYHVNNFFQFNEKKKSHIVLFYSRNIHFNEFFSLTNLNSFSQKFVIMRFYCSLTIAIFITSVCQIVSKKIFYMIRTCQNFVLHESDNKNYLNFTLIRIIKCG